MLERGILIKLPYVTTGNNTHTHTQFPRRRLKKKPKTFYPKKKKKASSHPIVYYFDHRKATQTPPKPHQSHTHTHTHTLKYDKVENKIQGMILTN